MTTRIAGGRRNHDTRAITAIALWCLVIAFSAGGAAAQSAGLEKIEHVIVIYEENWSFDGLYGKFPGVCLLYTSRCV